MLVTANHEGALLNHFGLCDDRLCKQEMATSTQICMSSSPFFCLGSISSKHIDSACRSTPVATPNRLVICHQDKKWTEAVDVSRRWKSLICFDLAWSAFMSTWEFPSISNLMSCHHAVTWTLHVAYEVGQICVLGFTYPVWLCYAGIFFLLE